MTKDTGDWLSAEQAVLPDGTERDNLSLINKKLPALSATANDNAVPPAASTETSACCGCGGKRCGDKSV